MPVWGQIPPSHTNNLNLKTFILLGCLAFAVSDINFHMLPPFLLRHLLARGVSEAGVGIVMATPAAIMLVAVFALPALARYNRLHLVIGGLVINSAGSLLLTLIDTVPNGTPVLAVALLLMLIKGFATGTFEVVMRGLLLASAPPEQVATVVGWLAASRNVGGLLGPVAGGLLFELGGLQLPAAPPLLRRRAHPRCLAARADAAPRRRRLAARGPRRAAPRLAPSRLAARGEAPTR